MEQINYIFQSLQLLPLNFFKTLFSTVFDKVALGQLPKEAYLSILALLLFIALLSLFQNYRNLLKARTIEDTPASKIRSTSQGYAEVTGKQYPLRNHEIIAPLSLRPCTWYRYEVYRKNNKNSWYVVSEGASLDHFIIKDPTGFCVVDPAGADIHPNTQDSWYGFSANPEGKSKYRILLILGFIFGGYQYKESRMEIGSSIYALGNFTTIRAGEGNLTQEALEKQAESLVKNWEKDYDALMRKFDLNKDGKLTPEENLKIQKTAELEIREKYASKNHDTMMNVLSNKGLTARQPFIISNFTQQELAKKYRTYSVLWLLLFLISMPYSLWWLSIKL
jgi:hypothetical protein